MTSNNVALTPTPATVTLIGMGPGDADRAEARASARRRADVLWCQRANRLSLTLAAIFAVAILNCAHFFRQGGGQLQFASQNLNHLALTIVVLLPVVVLLIRLAIPRTPSKMWLAAVSFVVAFFSFWFGTFFLTRRALILTAQTVSSGDTIIRCIRVEGFDTLAVAVQQERAVLPGVVWSVPLHRENFARDVRVGVINNHHVQYAFFKQILHGSESSLPSHTVVLTTH